MSAAKILILEDGGSPAPNLDAAVQKLGYEVPACLAPTADALIYASAQPPSLALIVVSLPGSVSAVEIGQRMQSELDIPVVYLAGQGGLSLLKRSGIEDPFSILRWPTDELGLKSHLDMALARGDLLKQIQDNEEHLHAYSRYRGLFEDSPVSLWEQDFSALKHTIEELRDQGVVNFREYFQQHPKVVSACLSRLRVIDVNKATLRLFQATSKEDLLAHMDVIFDRHSLEIIRDELIAIAEGNTHFEGDGINRDLAGNIIDVHVSWSVSSGSEADFSNVIVSLTDITARKRREDVLNVIVEVSAALRSAATRAEMLPIILDQVIEQGHANSAALILQNMDGSRITVELARGEWQRATGRELNGAASVSEWIISSAKSYANPDIRTEQHYALADLVENDYAVAAMPLMAQKQCFGALWVGRTVPFSPVEIDLLTAMAEIIANAIHRVSLHEQTKTYADQVSAVSAIGRTLATTLDLQEIYERLAQGVLELLPGISTIYISTYHSQSRMILYEFGYQDGERLDLGKIPPIPLDSAQVGSQGEVIRDRQPLIVNDLQARRRHIQTGILIGSPANNTQSGIYVPMLAQDEILGVMLAQSYKPSRFTNSDAELLTLAANTAAIAIQNARLFAATQQRLQRLTALHAIDVAISSSLDLRITLNILLDQLIALLHLDAADILLLDRATQNLEYTNGRGFRTTHIMRTQLKLGEGLPGQAVLENRVLTIPNLSETNITDRRSHLMASEYFTGYSAAPLVAKGQLKGVLEVFHRSVLNLDPEWQEFMETLAGQVAVAIDNATLVNQLQHTNLELSLAYENTLEGWARALSIRDKVTEDHTRRVTELTAQLAKAMGFNDAEIVHIRRGALLHDIGKLGIPDRILQKTGVLTDEERINMQRHPGLANEMLKDISFLAQARTIPYCHHEKWDGTGYPRGLQGEQIPLAARIFAVIDVWDSLCSNQPWRPGWPAEKAREYIRSNAGKHFDPQVVEVFLKVIP